MRQELKKRNLSDLEIEMLFAKYDIDQNRELDKHELQSMFDDLEGKKNQIEKEIEENKPTDCGGDDSGGSQQIVRHGIPTGIVSGIDYAKMTKRVDRMEYILATISTKIDNALADSKLITAATVAAGNRN